MKKIEPPPPFNFEISSELVHLLIKEEVQGIINKINEEYYYWDRVKHEQLIEGIDVRDIWSIVKIRRLNTPYKIQFGKYKFFWNLNSRSNGLLHFLDMNIGGNLESSVIVSREDKSRYLISSVMEEAIASSQIEGAVTTRKHAKEMLRKSIKPRNKSEQMIANNFVTIQKILDIKSEPINIKNFLEVHKLVTLNTLSYTNEEGALRDCDDINVIDTSDGEIVHAPPSHKQLSELLQDLFNFFNEDDPKLFVHPIIKACIIHFMVGFIHPFVDGNGRTARALFYWYLLKKQYWLTEYLSISRLILKSKASYAKAFQYSEIDQNDLTYFMNYNLRIMKLAFEELREYIKRKNEEKRYLNKFLGIDGINYRQALILEWFSNDPTLIITVKEAETRLGVSNASARTDLFALVKRGYIELKNINKVTKGYVKGVNLDLLRQKLKIAYKHNKNIPVQSTLFESVSHVT